ncbi:MAG: hypothetical protein V5A61_12225 [Haloarculaceae archaeon]
MTGRRKALLALLALLVPAVLLWGFVLGVADPGSGGEPTATYEIRYEGRTVALTQTAGRVATGTLAVLVDADGNRSRQVWVAPNGTGYDNGGRGHPVRPGDQFVFLADLSPGDTVRVVWTAGDGEERSVLAEKRLGATPTPTTGG